MATKQISRPNKDRETVKRVRALVAAATRLDISNKTEVNRQRNLRKNWQIDSFTYRNTIGEIRYAVNYLANCAARMRVFVAVLPDTGESDEPMDITKSDAPPELIEACQNALRDFGNGRTALAGHMHSASTNLSLAGEGFILGEENPMTGQQTWSIRSVSEIVVYQDKIQLREGPTDSTGNLGLKELDPNFTTLSRMWKPDPEFRLQADSPMRAILNECESLLIYRRMIRGVGRSRIAGRGFLLFPDELEIVTDNNDDDDPEASTLMQSLIDTLMTPVSDEGSAGAVVPGIIRGPAEFLKDIRLLEMGQSFDAEARNVRSELVGIIATGLDIPKEVILGMTDLNHWSAWQVDDDTFRAHVEPHVVTIMDCFTDGYLRPYIATSGLDPAIVQQWLPRIMFWYDPTELVTHPDQTANASLLHAALALSDAAYRRVLGFTEADAPTPQEIEIRMIRVSRQYPMNLMMALMHELDPSLAVPPITTTGTVPGIKPGIGGGADVPITPPLPGEAPSPIVPTQPESVTPTPPIPNGPPSDAVTASSIVQGMGLEARVQFLASLRSQFIERYGYDYYDLCNSFKKESFTKSITASGKDEVVPSAKSIRLSRKLQQIDAELRTKVTTAANAALLRQLEKAGGQVRNKVAAQSVLRTKIKMTKNEDVMLTLGKDVVEKSGLTASKLMASDWDTFKEQFMNWTTQAQKQAVQVAAQLAGIDETTAWAQTQSQMGVSAEKGWNLLRDSMDALAVVAAYNPDPNVDDDVAIAALNPDTLVPTGVIRAALGVCGGQTEQDYGLITTKSGATVPAIPLGNQVGGVATGSTIGGLLTNAGAVTSQYEWVHGPSSKPFEPHEALDGVEFSSFTDPALANNTDFPANQFYLPGDHIGCLCDVTPLWVSPQDVQDAIDNANS